MIFATVNTGGTTTYTWTNDNTTIGLAASGNDNIPFFTAVNTGTSPEIATIIVTPHFSNGSVSCNGPSQTFTITVNPTAQVNDPADQVVCNTVLTTPVNFATNRTGGITTYTWTNDNASIGLGVSGTADIAAFTATNTGTSPVVATIMVTPHFDNGSVICDGPVQTFTITVNPTAQADVPANQVVCNGSLTTAVNFTSVNTGGTKTYSWTNDKVSIGLVATGTGNIGSFIATNGGATPVVATIVVTPHFTNGSVTCDGPTQTFTITVNPTAQVNDPADQVVCNGAPTTLVAFITGNTGGITTYTWTNNATSINLAASGTGNIPSFTATNTGTSPIVATITVTPHFDNGSVTCNGPVQTFTITVNPTAQVNDPADKVVCNASGTSVTFSTVNTGGITTYSWTNDNTTIGIVASGTNNIPLFTATNPGTAPVVATITVTPHFDNGSVICDGPVQTFTITVNPTGQVNDPVDQVVCNGSYTAPVAFTTTNTGGTTTYTWSNDTPGIGLGAGGSGDITAFAGTNTGTAPVVATITVVPHFTNGSATCNGPSQTFTITVNPTGQVNLPASQVVCNGSATTAVNFSTTNTGGATTFTWTNSASGIGLAASGSGNIASFTAVNIGASPVVATIAVTPHFNNSSLTCDGPVQTFTITVNPTGQVNVPANQVVCNGSSTMAVNFVTVNSGGTTNYSWTNDNTSIGLVAASTGNIPAFTAVNTGTVPQVATITVIPHFINATVTCDGPSETFTITINPTPHATATGSTTICNSTSTSIALTSDVAGATFNWTIGAVAGGITGASASSGSTIGQVLINSGTSPGTVTYIVTPTANSCSGVPINVVVTVNPTPNVTSVGPTTICSSTATNIALSSNVMGATFDWTIGTITGGITGATASSGSTIAQTLTNPGVTPGIVSYIVTPTANSCTGSPITVVITVNPTPDVTTVSPTTICSATSTSIALVSAVSGTTFSWTIGAITGSVSGATASNGSTISQVLLNSGLTPGTVTYRVTPTANSCSGSITDFVVTVNPLTGPVNFTLGAQEVCQDAPDETYTATAANSTSIVYSVLPVAAGVINPVTGVMNWDAAFSGNATITATATGLCGTKVGNLPVNVKALPAIVTSPVSSAICEFSIVNFDVTATGSDLVYKWYVDDNSGSGFVPVTGGGTYSGENTATLQIWSTVRTMSGYKYRAEVSSVCSVALTSGAATLTINTAAELILHPSDKSLCLGENTTLEADVDPTGTAVTWEWLVNKGAGFVTCYS